MIEDYAFPAVAQGVVASASVRDHQNSMFPLAKS
jgi:hypothetical protein